MTGFALLLLLLTSLAPIALVYAGVLIEAGLALRACMFVGGCAVLVALAVALLVGVRRVCAPVPKEISEPSTKEGEPLGFLVLWALPIVALTPADKPPHLIGIAVFGAIMALVLWQQQVFHINPLLAALGWHFFGARNDGGGQILVLTRRKVLNPGDLSVVRLSEYLWLEAPNRQTERQNVGELPPGDREGPDGH